ncbi:hypothetical protein EGM_09462 [Macaca fascicularis]|uniref:Required for excision 1-B domain-containing protein n=1 Tax=Macaca fascicularis TaxID=9541 RepID=G7PX00_MACFA|nr:hypothetical protein EGM_09462 [Macaca fascicularis]
MITQTAAEPTVPAVPAPEETTEAPGRKELAWPWKDAPIRTLVQRIHQLQAERAQGFRRLEEGHRQYLRSGPDYDFARYRSTVHEVTQAFAAASREVLAVALLQLMETPELAGQEDAVQMHQLKMKVIKTMEAISEVLQDLRFDAESAE